MTLLSTLIYGGPVMGLLAAMLLMAESRQESLRVMLWRGGITLVVGVLTTLMGLLFKRLLTKFEALNEIPEIRKDFDRFASAMLRLEAALHPEQAAMINVISEGLKATSASAGRG